MTALPPGPNSVLTPLWRYLRDPYGATVDAFREWGDPHTNRALGTPMVMTRDSTLIKAILAGSPEMFDAFGVELMGGALGKSSLILLSGEKHRAARKLLTPPFHGERMRAYGRMMQAVTRQEARGWQRGRTFSMQGATQSISLRIIMQAVFGITEPAAEARMRKKLVEGIESLRPELLFLKPLQREFGGFGPWATFKKHSREMEALMTAEFAARRASPESREDILSLIMSARYDDGSPMPDQELYETLMTIVVAGHETTAISTAWAFYFIHRHPEVKAKLVEELRTLADDPEPDTIAGLPYLEAVCHETMRLHPVAPSIVRTLRQPFQLGEWTLPPGVAVAASIIGLHHREDLYPDPQQFKPERFVGRTFAPSEFMPFGGGYERCIGAAFAMYEMKIVVATLMREYALELKSTKAVGARPRSTIIGAAKPIQFALA